jgi:hypothetical protein
MDRHKRCLITDFPCATHQKLVSAHLPPRQSSVLDKHIESLACSAAVALLYLRVRLSQTNKHAMVRRPFIILVAVFTSAASSHLRAIADGRPHAMPPVRTL